MDKVVFHHPRRPKISKPTSSGASRTRSDYGLLKDMARNHVRSFKKKGFTALVDRLKRDAFYQFNAANSCHSYTARLSTPSIHQNLVPEAMKFIERLAGCIAPATAPRIRSSASAWTSRHDWSLSPRRCGSLANLWISMRRFSSTTGGLSGHWPVRRLHGEDLEALWKALAYYLWMGQPRI